MKRLILIISALAIANVAFAAGSYTPAPFDFGKVQLPKSNSGTYIFDRIATTAGVWEMGAGTLRGVSVGGDTVLGDTTKILCIFNGRRTVSIDFDSICFFNTFLLYSSPGNVGINNTFAGESAGCKNTAGWGNTFYGAHCGNYLRAVTNAVENTAVGWLALWKDTVGFWNTAVGAGALGNLNNGNENTAIGADALGQDSASNNTAVGCQALAANLSGTPNVAVGRNALKVHRHNGDNVAIGASALSADTSGTANTAVGSAALCANLKGQNNVAIGCYAGLNLTSNSNTLIGSSAGSNLTTGAENILIGSATQASAVNASNEFVAGSSSARIEKVYFGRGVSYAGTASYTIYGTSASTGDVNGGDVRLIGGAKSGTGLDGNVYLGYDGSVSRGNVLMGNVYIFGYAPLSDTTMITNRRIRAESDSICKKVAFTGVNNVRLYIPGLATSDIVTLAAENSPAIVWDSLKTDSLIIRTSTVNPANIFADFTFTGNVNYIIFRK